ncbi:hypothetical protein Ocin01_00883 [Orchesella cincta]|uniref:Uncharacterized protein n=1 Tax=Orchesella cincta TaxID=48709 RepID=A0A1D2NKN2_ORCCI|nr:hypothetical protein Ocin01_00883 [Orchesella cincta]
MIVQPPTPSSTTTSSCSSSAAATSTTTTTATSKRKQEGCRCGNATPNPGSGKLTCIGAGGKKVLHSQTSQAIPFVSSMAGGLTSATMLPSVTSTASNVSLASNVNFGPMQAGPSTGVTHPTVQLIPLRFGQPGLGQYIQIANAHGLQQLPVQQIFFNGASLPSSATGITIQGVPVSSLSGIHQMAQIQQQQQRPPLQMGMHLKADRNPNDGI